MNDFLDECTEHQCHKRSWSELEMSKAGCRNLSFAELGSTRMCDHISTLGSDTYVAEQPVKSFAPGLAKQSPSTHASSHRGLVLKHTNQTKSDRPATLASFLLSVSRLWNLERGLSEAGRVRLTRPALKNHTELDAISYLRRKPSARKILAVSIYRPQNTKQKKTHARTITINLIRTNNFIRHKNKKENKTHIGQDRAVL